MTSIEHYDCQKPHRIGETGKVKHFFTCNAAPGHDQGVTTGKCGTCHKAYYKKYWDSDWRREKIAAGYRRSRNHPHYDCHLSRKEHSLYQGIGAGHRAGCQVALGHTAGLSAGNACAACGTYNRRKRLLFETYGITFESYDEMVSRQQGRCAICNKVPDGVLSIDHDHSSGKVRGLLCTPCNTALGALGDDPKRLKRAARYLEKHTESA